MDQPRLARAADAAPGAAAAAPGQQALRQRLSAYTRIALVLQGGGALGAYQAGVMQALEEAGIAPNWVAGISIGAINAALIAGSAPGQRTAALRAFWQQVTEHPVLPPLPWNDPDLLSSLPAPWQAWCSQLQGWRSVLEGQRGFFTPRLPGLGPTEASFYDTAPLRATLEELVDFHRLNDGSVRVTLGTVNVASGQRVVFDNAQTRIGPEHVMASGALPPGFPAVQIDGEYYWDGGVASNTPLAHLLDRPVDGHTLAIQVDLWNAAGPLPQTLAEVVERQKDIQYASRTRLITELAEQAQRQRELLRDLLATLPPEVLAHHPRRAELEAAATDRRCTILHLVYRSKPFDGQAKDYTFGRAEMLSHWQAGLCDMVQTLQQL